MGCCQTLAGVSRNCDYGAGGVRRVLMACKDDINPDGITITNEQISAITAEDCSFKVYELPKESSSVTMTWTKDTAARTGYWENVVTIVMRRMDTPKKIEVDALSVSDLVMIVEDNNGKYWYFGYDYPVEMTGGTAQTGAAFTDANGYDLEFTDNSFKHPYEVLDSVIDTLLASCDPE